MKYLIERIREKQENLHEWVLYKQIPVRIKNSNVKTKFFQDITRIIEEKVPFSLFQHIKGLNFFLLPEMEERNIHALCKDNVIYISPIIQNENQKQILRDIIHELGHSLEIKNYDFIFKDENLISEFEKKRQFFYSILKETGFRPPIDLLYTIEYRDHIEEYISSIEDSILNNKEYYLRSLFLDLYSCISLQEYWASGFEEYFFDKKKLTDVSELLYAKVYELVEDKR